MKTVFATILVASFALPVAAQEIIEFDDHFVSMRTRAEVQAEVASAAAEGQLEAAGEALWYPTTTSTSSTLTRAEVQAELARAAAAGELNMQGEITVVPPLHPRGGSTRLASRGVDRAW